MKSRLVWVEPYRAQLLAENKAHANAAAHAAHLLLLLLLLYIYIYIHIYEADANAAAKELADAAHVCARMLTYVDVCRNRGP